MLFVFLRLVDVQSLSDDPLDWTTNAEPFPLMHVLTTQYYAVKLYGLSISDAVNLECRGEKQHCILRECG